jgi:ubiquinol-cytochrome c reductase cytochrome b subunit
VKAVLEWLHARTGYRSATESLLDEELPAGTGWFFTFGSVLLALLAVQLLTGAVLTLYYAPTPDHAYDSIRFIIGTLPGRLVHGLHHYGASFMVVALVVHMTRVVLFGSYKAPREATWLSGLALFGLVLAFSLTGYLLPWDQRAYWATVVTINIARITPLAGDLVGGALQGGATVGALTLTRWYALHVIFLPAALIGLVVLHVYLMRRHGISGPVRPREGPAQTFYPWQAARDTAVVALVLTVLVFFAWPGAPPLEGRADPSATTYVPRPEWYFLGLFELLKYFPGRWEVVGAMVIPGIVAGLLAALPWLDRGPARDPRRRPLAVGGFALGLVAVVALTTLGWMDRPPNQSSPEWSVREIGGRVLAQRANCESCHAASGIADPLESATSGRAAEWIGGHVSDPEMIAPGVREPPVRKGEREIAAIVAYVQRLSRGPYPGFDPQTESASATFARHCIGCHEIDGDGGSEGPVLSRIGGKHDAAYLERLITDPESVNPKAEMPALGSRISAAEVKLLAAYLAARR